MYSHRLTLTDTMLLPAASALDRLRMVLRRRDEGAGGSTTIAAAPLEQRYAAGTDRGRQAYDAEAAGRVRYFSSQLVRVNDHVGSLT
jgi:hypothetical protein